MGRFENDQTGTGRVKDIGTAAGLVAQVAVGLPIWDTFTYRVPPLLETHLSKGMRVWIPFRNRRMIGYVVGVESESESGTQKLKDVFEPIDEEPILDDKMLELTQWISGYYLCSWGEAIENALPSVLKRGGKLPAPALEELSEKASNEPRPEWILHPEQAEALEQIASAIQEEKHSLFLLHGITGSGKTEIYIRAIEHCLALGKMAICLVPEIALTQQLEEWFRRCFGQRLAVFHSGLTDKQRMESWVCVRSGLKQVVLGPRSALFAPVQNLGLLILDEEHEPSYKQQDVPRYHAREVARKRAEQFGSVLVLGSATPSLEAMYEVERGRAKRLCLSQRTLGAALPRVDVVDLRNYVTRSQDAILSPYLREQMAKALAEKESVLLFLNRRGFATHILCTACGYFFNCKHCEVALTFHEMQQKAICHYCNFQLPRPQSCPVCHSTRLRFSGIGTEKVESEVARHFPKARVERLDRDRAQRKGVAERVLSDFRSGRIDILVGTQMIAKGFDFPNVTLVGVVQADTVLSLPDFRAAERTFQLLTQVAGRSGRGTKQGSVVVQTFLPDHYAIRFAKEHDYEHFYNCEVEKRREFNYPPFSHLINLMIRGRQENTVYQHARRLAETLKEILEKSVDKTQIDLLGPAPLPFYRLQGAYRWHIMLKGSRIEEMNPIVVEALKSMRPRSGVRVAADVDPSNIL